MIKWNVKFGTETSEVLENETVVFADNLKEVVEKVYPMFVEFFSKLVSPQTENFQELLEDEFAYAIKRA